MNEKKELKYIDAFLTIFKLIIIPIVTTLMFYILKNVIFPHLKIESQLFKFLLNFGYYSSIFLVLATSLLGIFLLFTYVKTK